MVMKTNLYVTTAIPYVNGTPHIGNALDYLYADIWKRYQEQQGKKVRFQVGTDEHGNKIATKAASEGMTPQEYVDKMAPNFAALMDKVDAKYTDFIRTTEPHHTGAVQYIWQQLQPHIYKDIYEGWYCMGHEAFFTQKEVTENSGVCPDHQTPYEQVKEENYFLRCSDFSDQLREAIETNKMQIIPEFRKKEFLELMKDGLKDVSISRPRKSLSWGIPVPGDPEQIMYVWLDALSNYLTILGYPDREEWKEYWPADVQIIGKDILRFHAGIWPPMLLGLGLPLPKKMLVHGFVNVNGAKMSKTVGNVIDPNEIIDNYGVDAFRYYFARHIPTQDDGDFTWEKFENAYNTELANDLGNAIQRVASMVVRYQAGVVGDVLMGEHDMQPYRESMDNLSYDRALDDVWVTIRSLNGYLENVKPWQIAKDRDKDPDAAAHLSEVLGHAVGTLDQIADLLVPFLPGTSAYIKATFADGIVHLQDSVLFPKIYLHTSDPKVSKPAEPQTPAPAASDKIS